ncbi:hypothetical protein QZH41_007944 [Actinostola sp. cb2023]|nr:hypothetical protein QZH41_007944 [Actinostola sp. cb2023]
MAATTALGSRAFGHAKQYDAFREVFPTEVVTFLLNKLDVSRNTDSKAVILELGAGTGKFTKVMTEILKGSSTTIVASDPSKDMCQEFQDILPEIEIHKFSAQKIVSRTVVDKAGNRIKFHCVGHSDRFDE